MQVFYQEQPDSPHSFVASLVLVVFMLSGCSQLQPAEQVPVTDGREAMFWQDEALALIKKQGPKGPGSIILQQYGERRYAFPPYEG